MKKNKWILSLVFAIILGLSSCTNSNTNENITENKEISESLEETGESKTDQAKSGEDSTNSGGLINEAVEREVGKPYEVGVTPDDYNMDYDTSRMHDLKAKKSEYYPEDGVKGLYLNSYSVNNPEVYNKIIEKLDSTKLNSVVVDIKDDWGNVTMNFDTDDEDIKYSKIDIIDPEAFLEEMHSRDIYVIGRVTTFKDSIITERHPDWGFTLDDGSLWKNGHGEAFMNPFLKEVQDYDIKIAKLAAEAGFDEIQFDYVRFAEGFETFGDTLSYSRGEYEDTDDMEEGEKRVAAITGFVQRSLE